MVVNVRPTRLVLNLYLILLGAKNLVPTQLCEPKIVNPELLATSSPVGLTINTTLGSADIAAEIQTLLLTLTAKSWITTRLSNFPLITIVLFGSRAS